MVSFLESNDKQFRRTLEPKFLDDVQRMAVHPESPPDGINPFTSKLSKPTFVNDNIRPNLHHSLLSPPSILPLQSSEQHSGSLSNESTQKQNISKTQFGSNILIQKENDALTHTQMYYNTSSVQTDNSSLSVHKETLLTQPTNISYSQEGSANVDEGNKHQELSIDEHILNANPSVDPLKDNNENNHLLSSTFDDSLNKETSVDLKDSLESTEDEPDDGSDDVLYLDEDGFAHVSKNENSNDQEVSNVMITRNNISEDDQTTLISSDTNSTDLMSAENKGDSLSENRTSEDFTFSHGEISTGTFPSDINSANVLNLEDRGIFSVSNNKSSDNETFIALESKNVTTTESSGDAEISTNSLENNQTVTGPLLHSSGHRRKRIKGHRFHRRRSSTPHLTSLDSTAVDLIG